MPDLGSVVGALFEALSPILGPALRALFGTLVGMIVVGSATTAGAVWFAAGGSVVRGAIAAILCLVLLSITTAFLAVKNAVLRGLLAAVRNLRIGRRAFDLLFDQLGVGDGSSHGERLGAVGRAVERIPLREAEARLGRAVQRVVGQRAQQSGMRGWIARKLLAGLLERIAALTLVQFRSEGASHGGHGGDGGIDLSVVRDHLGARVDDLIGSQVEAQARRLTILVVAGYVLGVALIAWLVSHIPVQAS